MQEGTAGLLLVLPQVLALASITVAALSLLLSYRERVAPMRTALYVRQVDVLCQLYETLATMALPLVTAADRPETWNALSTEERQAEMLAAMEKSFDLRDLIAAQNAVIPASILESVLQVQPLLLAGFVDAVNKSPEQSAVDLEPLREALDAVRIAIRTTIGTDHLHRTGLRMFGVGRRKWERNTTVPLGMTREERREFYDLARAVRAQRDEEGSGQSGQLSSDS